MNRPVLRASEIDTNVQHLQRLLLSNGYGAGYQSSIGVTGFFDDNTEDQVEMFQLQHIGSDGEQLDSDGIVGSQTWWALENPSGASQKNNISQDSLAISGLTPIRAALISLILEEHEKGVRETPDGSNRSRDIDQYWGDLKIRGKPWCCTFVSWGLYETLDDHPIGGVHNVGVIRMSRTAVRAGFQVMEPKPGDIFVQEKRRGKGHTGFVIGVSRDGRSIYTCEGNCGNRLKIGKRKVSSITRFLDVLGDEQDDSWARGELNAADVGSDTDR